MYFHQVPITFVNEVSIKVQSLSRSLAFYQDIIGLKVLNITKAHATLTADGIHSILRLEQPHDVSPKEYRTTGLYHFALLVPTRDDLANVLSHLMKVGYPLQGASDHLVSEAVYLADPDGNGIEIYADRPSDEWEWDDGQVVMATNSLNVRDLLLHESKEPWEGLPEKTIMGHIHLHVSELHNTEKFYCKGLGFEVVTRYGGQALFISSENYHHHIGLNTWNGVGAPKPSRNSVGLNWFSIVYSSKSELELIINRLGKLGYHVGTEEGLYVTEDPSGNKIRLLNNK